jgi:hypothetical protein
MFFFPEKQVADHRRLRGITRTDRHKMCALNSRRTLSGIGGQRVSNFFELGDAFEEHLLEECEVDGMLCLRDPLEDALKYCDLVCRIFGPGSVELCHVSSSRLLIKLTKILT